MSLDSAKQAKMLALLAALPDRRAAELLAACEGAVARGQPSPLPLDLVREAMAGRKGVVLARAFGAVLPLVQNQGGPKQPGRIARASLDSVAALAEQVAPTAYAALAAGEPPINAHREILGRALRGELRHDEGAETRYRSKLGGERGYDDACDISALLCAEPELSDGLAGFPERIEELDEAQVRRVRDLYEQVAGKDRSAPLLLLFLVLERLEKRAQILRVLKKIAGQDDDLLAQQTDIGAIGDLLLNEADAAVAAMGAPLHGVPDGPGLVEAVSSFAAISRGMTRELGIRRDGKWGLRLKELRARAAKHMDAVCAAAPKAIDGALPLARIALDGGAPMMRPAVDSAPREDAYARGLNFAIILGGVGEHASSVAFAAEYAKARDAAERIVDAYSNGVFELLQYADVSMLSSVEPWRALAERFVESLLGERAVSVFGRRAAAALAARVQADVA